MAKKATDNPGWAIRILEVITQTLEIATGPDRVVAIVGAASLDVALHRVLQQVLKNPNGTKDNLLDTERPLFSFAAKTELAERLGLLTPEYASCLHAVRRVRNDFAHSSRPCSLSTPPARDHVSSVVNAFADRPKDFQKICSTFFKDVPSPKKEYGAALTQLAIRLEHLLQDLLRLKRENRLSLALALEEVPLRLWQDDTDYL